MHILAVLLTAFTQLPPCDIHIESAAEIAAQVAQSDALEAEIARIETAIEKAKATRQSPEVVAALRQQHESVTAQLRELVSHPDPAFHEQLPGYNERLKQVAEMAGGSGAIRPETVHALADELYIDQQHPSLNYRMQVVVMTELNAATLNPSISDESIAAMRDRLVGYYRDGGGVASPIMETELASALFRVSSPEDVEAFEIVQALCDDAEAWSRQLGRSREYEHRFVSLREHMQAARELYAEAASMGEGESTEEADDRPAVVPEASESKEIEKSVESVDVAASREAYKALTTRLRLRDNMDVAEVQQAYAMGVVSPESIKQLLRTYYLILRKPNGVSQEVISLIEKHLVEIARSDRLSKVILWQSWERAVLQVKKPGAELIAYLLKPETASKVSAAMYGRSIRRACRHLVGERITKRGRQ